MHNITKANFGDDVHAFLRYTDKTCLLIVNSFNDVPASVKIEIPEAKREELSYLKQAKAKDLLNSQNEITLANFETTLVLKPYSSFIFEFSK